MGCFGFNFLFSRCSFYLHDRTEQIATALEKINEEEEEEEEVEGKKTPTNLDKLKRMFAKQSNAIKKRGESCQVRRARPLDSAVSDFFDLLLHIGEQAHCSAVMCNLLASHTVMQIH